MTLEEISSMQGWPALIARGIEGSSTFQYEWKSGSKIEFRIDLDQPILTAPLEFKSDSSALKGTIGYSLDQSLLYLTAGINTSLDFHGLESH